MALCALGMWACTEQSEPAAKYTVRGEIADIPNETGEQLVIRHEAIDGFRDRHGEQVGMKAMTMAFGRAENVRISHLTEGDKIRFTFEVHWKARQPLRIIRLEKLASDTQLELAVPSR